MRTDFSFEGLEAASEILTKELRKVGKENSEKFVILSLKSVEAQTAPLVPVDTSELINSAFSRVSRLKNSTFIGEFGYGASYAPYVHDGGPKNWQKSGASDRFLELGVQAFIEEDLNDLLKLLGE